MTTPKQFPPRAYIDAKYLAINGHATATRYDKEDHETEYLSLQEHESILAEERAKVWKEAAARLSYSFLNPGQGFQPTYGQIENFCNEFRSKAAREGK